MSNVLVKVKAPVPLSDDSSKLVNIPLQMDKVKKFLNLEETEEDPSVVFQAMHQNRKNCSHSPFFITLVVINLLLHNYMLDSSASTNVMPLKVINHLGLKTMWPYMMYAIWIQDK